MALSHDLCRCGHDRRVHGVFGQVCVACDCRTFVRERLYRDRQGRRPTLSVLVRRLARRVGWDRDEGRDHG